MISVLSNVGFDLCREKSKVFGIVVKKPALMVYTEN